MFHSEIKWGQNDDALEGSGEGRDNYLLPTGASGIGHGLAYNRRKATTFHAVNDNIVQTPDLAFLQQALTAVVA